MQIVSFALIQLPYLRETITSVESDARNMLENLQSLETPVHSAEKKLVLKTISELPGEITAADIATKTALPVLTTSALLNQIAYETGGHLTVGSSGSIAYKFDRNFQQAYIARSSKNMLLRIWRIIVNCGAYLARIFTLVMFFVIRISFGLMLIFSVVLVALLIIAVVLALLSKLGGDNDSGPDFDLSDAFRGWGGGIRYWTLDWLWDWWYWSDYLKRDGYYSGRQKPGNIKTKERRESFLDKCFSFLFGEGNPNEQLEKQRWQSIGALLKANSGVVVAEQIAPFVDKAGNNEDWVLPVLIRFNGNCDVSDSGNIIYSFPAFQQEKAEQLKPQNLTIAGDSSPADEYEKILHEQLKRKELGLQRQKASEPLTDYLREQNWKLHNVSEGSRNKIICFAVFILLGSIWLMCMSVTMPLLQIFLPLLAAMAIYGALFFIIPGIRLLFINKANTEIKERNATRYNAFQRLKSDSSLQNKLQECGRLRTEAIEKACSESVAFSTERDSLEQEFN